jgi:hypothetical protein
MFGVVYFPVWETGHGVDKVKSECKVIYDFAGIILYKNDIFSIERLSSHLNSELYILSCHLNPIMPEYIFSKINGPGSEIVRMSPSFCKYRNCFSPFISHISYQREKYPVGSFHSPIVLSNVGRFDDYRALWERFFTARYGVDAYESNTIAY